MTFDLAESLDLLVRTPAVIESMLSGTPASWHALRTDPAVWSAVEVVGHLIHADETNWVPRIRAILEHGESQPFQPFDRFAQMTRFSGWPLTRLLRRFAELRQDQVAQVRHWQLTDHQLSLTGRHPEFGQVSLAQLLATWVVHDLNHLAQINRVMAKRYIDAVGPWRAYLPILRPG